MAAALPSLSPLWRNSLRIWLASTLTIGILFWSGRDKVLALALVMVVLFVNENDLTPARSIGQQVGGALIGILTAIVLHEISTSWAMLGKALLITGVLVRSLGLLKGLSMGYLSCWAVELLHHGKQFNWALIFNMTFAVVVGILMAQIATWALWPRRPLQQLPALEARIASQLSQQISAMQQWLSTGGPPPPALRSQDLLPSIQLLQQLRDQNRGLPIPAHTQHLFSRWAQAGSLWRQVLRQWLLLEPLLRQLAAPLPPENPQLLLCSSLADLAWRLQAKPAAAPEPSPSSPAQLWLEEAGRLGAPQPLLLAIGQQFKELQQLLYSRALLQASAQQRLGSSR
jgi:hypothetical protein